MQHSVHKNSNMNLWGIHNLNPDRCDGEDDRTIAEHMSCMAKQFRLTPSAKDNRKIKIAMERTFP